jgi:hypothetical protein
MKIIINSPTHGINKVLVDDEDAKIIDGKRLYISQSGPMKYVRFADTKQFLHRTITNAPKGMLVDHINRNPLDNRRSNLRICTMQENLRNQKRPNNKTGYTGVAVYGNGRYTAQIKIDYKKIHLGCFDTIEDAYLARKEAEKKYWGG